MNAGSTWTGHNNINAFFDRIGVPDEKRGPIIEKINNTLSYKPKIGFFGKTGAGKSSLCNALFGQKLFKISDVASCTRITQQELLNIGANKNIILVDVPGVGENKERDNEYEKLYKNLLPELDLVLWVLKGDDRAFSSDEYFYKNIVKPHINKGKPFFFVLNQVDKIEPFREWNEAEHRPGITQFSNIHKKIEAVANSFACIPGKIVAVSANENYNLSVLVETFIDALRDDQIKDDQERKEDQTRKDAATVNIAREVVPEHRTEKTKRKAEQSFMDIVKKNVTEIWEAGKERVEKAWKDVKDFGKKIWDNTIGRCFITTAACETLGKPDNCRELNLFREFRDGWLEKQPDGKELIREYYDVAPQIVNSINKQAEREHIYRAVWNDYLSDCLQMIENGDYPACKDKYIAMVRNLEREYL